MLYKCGSPLLSSYWWFTMLKLACKIFKSHKNNSFIILRILLVQRKANFVPFQSLRVAVSNVQLSIFSPPWFGHSWISYRIVELRASSCLQVGDWSSHCGWQPYLLRMARFNLNMKMIEYSSAWRQSQSSSSTRTFVHRANSTYSDFHSVGVSGHS